jgi:hypothetical protein
MAQGYRGNNSFALALSLPVVKIILYNQPR